MKKEKDVIQLWLLKRFQKVISRYLSFQKIFLRFLELRRESLLPELDFSWAKVSDTRHRQKTKQKQKRLLALNFLGFYDESEDDYLERIATGDDTD